MHYCCSFKQHKAYIECGMSYIASFHTDLERSFKILVRSKVWIVVYVFRFKLGISWEGVHVRMRTCVDLVALRVF